MRRICVTVCLVLSGCNIFQSATTTTSDCGNGILEPGEFCDGDCPTSCNDGNVCSTDTLIGDPGSCTARCSAVEITACEQDGCCATGCTKDNDPDCANCGNGTIDGAETCDGNCPDSCDDMNACTTDETMGRAESCNVFCRNEPIVECNDNDGCCPSTCDETNDSDCATCGDGVVEEGETCDRAIEDGIGTCDFNCGSSSECSIGVITGSPSSCDVVCTVEGIEVCDSGDGCCPLGCTADNDFDCQGTCGNGDVDPGETCDPMNVDAPCPSTCNDDDVCTANTLVGSATDCTAECEFAPITACTRDDGCCPEICNAEMDNDCVTVGSPCEEDEDCPIVNGERKCEDGIGFTDGYCSGECDFNEDCPKGSRCFDEDCYAECASAADCRPDYQCVAGGGGMICAPN